MSSVDSGRSLTMSSIEREVSSESAGSDVSSDRTSEMTSESPTQELPPTHDIPLTDSDAQAPHLSDLELLAKLEEANRELKIMSPSSPSITTTDPTQFKLLVKLEEANRLLEADKKTCKVLTPTHSRTGSSAGPVSMGSGSNLGHSRKGSSTSMVSETNSTNEEESANSTSNLWEIWGKIVNDWASAKKKPAFIKQLVRRGIPNPFRGLAWQLILDVNTSPMKDMYVEYLKQKSPSEKMIRRDIARTFPEHDFFKEKNGLGQESLFHVMKVYSLHDREVGYCQGSGFIVGLLLMQIPEEETFAVLVKLMQDYRLRELFKPSMAELGLCMYKLECLIQELLPDLHTHFQSQSFHTSMYASPWFLTLFATVVPITIACRVMDLFISEGMEAIFRIGIAILQSSQTELLSMDMESMLQFFQKEIGPRFERDEEALFNLAYQVRFSAKKFKRLEKEYTALKSKENEDQIELRRLRTENRLLRTRIDNLEKESALLADRLIQYQLTRAQEAEDTYALKNELSLTKQKYSQSQNRLKEKETLLGEIKERTDSINSATSLDEGESHVVIQTLQEELIMVRLREAENMCNLKNLRNKIVELEQLNTQIQQAPSNDIQCLQEELIAVKLREAEANLSLKEMRQTIADLDANWQKHLANSDPQSSPRDRSGKTELKNELKKAQEDLMSSKLREAAVLSHLKDTKQRVMELETSNQICTNQIRRMDDENKKAKVQEKEAENREGELQRQVKALLRKIDDLETKRKEESMMARINEAESDQVIGELKQKMAEMEIRKEETLVADRLESKGGKQDLENTIFDLQEEVLQLRLSASPRSPHSSTFSTSPQVSEKIEEDDDFEDDDDIEDPESLNRTLSEIIEGKRSSTSLIAILNRENSDCDSIQSSSSENSRSGKKTKIKILFGEGETNRKRSKGGIKTGNILDVNNSSLNKNCDIVDNEHVQDETCAINQSVSGNSTVTHSWTGSETDSQTETGNGKKTVTQSELESGAITENQTQNEIRTIVNGDQLSDNEIETDSNKNISVDRTKHKTVDTKTVTNGDLAT